MIWLGLGLGAVGLALATANALTTRRLWSSATFDRPQKIAQTVMLWLLPGSFVAVRHFLTEPHGTPVRDFPDEVGPLYSPEYDPPDHGHGGGGGGHDGF
jgi:hypothetical protein